MSEYHDDASKSSSSGINESFREKEDKNFAGSLSSSSSGGDSNNQDVEHMTIGGILAEKTHSANGSLGKRLSHLDSIPHTPRVNGEIPDMDNATLDHERLSERLSTYGLAELQIEGDGNCQFRALADQLFRNPEYHKHVRKKVVKQLKHHKKLYEGYVPMDYNTYLKNMKRSGEWGDHVTLQAAADRYGAKICLLTSFKDTCFIEIIPKDNNPSKELWLSFWSEVHYNSLYGTGDLPTRVNQKKHWFFRGSHRD
ncbi:hypothetical protein QJS10_CPB11g01464 [Acorus calamus]|uniref:ubiquitinyl hydrolase 1 n=1 Tax=Acorus calamus TaxID=4465 RepID=A0AAV9DT31_ACOCL|nr:hypothetical protein QJS10_CPB11g01464 [Acorus calamus]